MHEGSERAVGALDAHLRRRRLRAIFFKHGKRKKTMIRKLVSLGVRRNSRTWLSFSFL